MVKLLSIISLILALVLFPPAALAVISNNAVPGDATYPIKRSLEDIIFAVASVNPVTKAWFAAARSDRRFQEFKTLVAQGKKGAETLNELVEQTNIAATQIAQVTDPTQKIKLIKQLSGSIDKYDQGLQQLSTPSLANPVPASQAIPSPQATAGPIQSEPVPQEEPIPTTSPAQVRPTVRPQPGQTSAPVVQPTPRPTLTSQPTPIPTPRPTPAPTPSPSDADRQRQIDEVRRQLEEIRRRLGEESSRHQINRQQSREEKKENSDK